MQQGRARRRTGRSTTREIAEVRRRIDAIDDRLVVLLDERAALAAAAGRAKARAGRPAYAPEREREVLARVVAQSRGPLPPEVLRAIFAEIMGAALALEEPAVAAGTSRRRRRVVMAMVLRDEPGSLRRALLPLARRHLSVSRIESRAARSGQRFFVELDAQREEPRVREALAELATICESMKVLGSYPRPRADKGHAGARQGG